MVEDDEVEGGGGSSYGKIAARLTSMLRTSSATRSLENLTPTAVMVKDDEDNGGGGERISKSGKCKNIDLVKAKNFLSSDEAAF